MPLNRTVMTSAGGKRIGDHGFAVEPAVFSDVQDHVAIAHDEVLCHG